MAQAPDKDNVESPGRLCGKVSSSAGRGYSFDRAGIKVGLDRQISSSQSGLLMIVGSEQHLVVDWPARTNAGKDDAQSVGSGF